MRRPSFALLLAFALASAGAAAQEDPPQSLTVLFATGSSTVSPREQEQLDAAARLFRDGNPVVMVVTGSADTVGDPGANLDLSVDRARAVARGLVARGIPAGRLQVLGQGNSELPVSTDDEVPNAQNRSATITWRLDG
jgi:outer membrane protein OmpA-like peptidoglycan-associated protein